MAENDMNDDKLDIDDSVSTPSESENDDFDYQKEIDEIEAQERELAKRREQKMKELNERRQAREEKKDPRQAKREESRRQKELRERRKESEWLGEPFDEEEEAPVLSSGPKKKKSGKGLVALIVILVLIAAGGGAFAFKTQMDKKTVSDFQAKVSAFQTDKLDGASLGSDASYFEDFMKQCQEAIDAKNISKIKSLNKQWADMEKKFTDDQTGRAALDSFAGTVKTTLAKYQTTSQQCGYPEEEPGHTCGDT